MGNYDYDNDTILPKKINFVVQIMLILHVKPKKTPLFSAYYSDKNQKFWNN